MAHRKVRMSCRGAAGFFVFILAALPAAAQTFWRPQQVTSTTVSQQHPVTVGEPAISADGSVLAFLSIADLGGLNPLGSPELFAYLRDPSAFEKLTHYDVPGGFLPTNTMRQLSRDGVMVLYTESSGNGMQWVLQNRSTGVRKEGPGYATFLNPSGTFALFFSNEDLVGENGDGSWELYRYDIANDAFVQLTHDVTMLRGEAVASDDGSSIVVISPDDLVPGSNADGSVELFELHPSTGTWTQLTSNPQGSDFWNLSMDAAGSRLAFISSFDLTGGNPDGAWEVFLLQLASGSILQLTSNTEPLDITEAISGNGETVVIETQRDLTGDNPDHQGALFTYDVRSRTLRQISDPSLGSVVSAPPAVDTSGGTVAVAAGGDFAGTNPDGNVEIFLFTRPGARPGIPADTPLPRLLLVLLVALSGAYLLIREALGT